VIQLQTAGIPQDAAMFTGSPSFSAEERNVRTIPGLAKAAICGYAYGIELKTAGSPQDAAMFTGSPSFFGQIRGRDCFAIPLKPVDYGPRFLVLNSCSSCLLEALIRRFGALAESFTPTFFGFFIYFTLFSCFLIDKKSICVYCCLRTGQTGQIYLDPFFTDRILRFLP